MKRIMQQVAIFILSLTISGAAFAAVAREAIAATPQAFSAVAGSAVGGGVPPAVLDRNFRAWQPPRPVPIYASYGRNDVAWTDGNVIYYNPAIASQMPAKVATFILAHEYGHIYQRTSNEVAADQFAARTYAQVDRGVVYAAIWHMANIQPYASDATHPPGLQRAYLIGQAAGLSRSQTEAIMRGEF